MFSDRCQMSYGDQATLVGLLSRLTPSVSVELGTYQGGSVEILARHSTNVHSFDLASHDPPDLDNVEYHLGDSRSTVPKLLSRLEAAGQGVDFVLIDGDHERRGVAADVSAVLDSPAVSRTVILLHDAANEDVRAGIRDAGLDRPKIAYADLSFTAPTERTRLLAEKWGGFALIVVDTEGDFWPHHRGVAPSARWATSTPQSTVWHASRPFRWAKRRVGYLIRPLVRRARGSYGSGRT